MIFLFLSYLSVCIYVAVYILQCFHVGQDKIDIRYMIYERSVSNLFVCPPSQLLVDREKMIDEHCTAQLYACISYWSVVMRWAEKFFTLWSSNIISPRVLDRIYSVAMVPCAFYQACYLQVYRPPVDPPGDLRLPGKPGRDVGPRLHRLHLLLPESSLTVRHVLPPLCRR